MYTKMRESFYLDAIARSRQTRRQTCNKYTLTHALALGPEGGPPEPALSPRNSAMDIFCPFPMIVCICLLYTSTATATTALLEWPKLV